MPRARPGARDSLALLQQRFATDVCVSPDGQRVLAVERWSDLESDRVCHALVVIQVASGSRRLLPWGTHNDTEPCWTPDGSGVVFVSDRGGQSDLWLHHLPDDRAQGLTELGGLVRSPRLGPDGEQVAFLHGAPRTDAPALALPGPHLRHRTPQNAAAAEHAARGYGWVQLWLLNLRTGRRRRLTPARADVAAFAWSPVGNSLAVVLRSAPGLPDGDEIWLVPLRRGRSRRLTRQPGPKLAPAWSPDGKAIAYFGHGGAAAAAEPLRLWRLAARGGKPLDVLHGEELHCAPAGFHGTEPCTPPIWSPDGAWLFFLASRAGAVDVYRVPATGGKPVARTQGEHAFTALTSNARGDVWALLRSDASHAAEVYAAVASRSPTARPSGGLRRLTRLHARHRGVTPLREFHVEAPGGRRLHGFFRRGRRSSRPGPALLVLHGGTGAMAGWSFVAELQILAAAGYHVFCPNIRGSAGYGDAYLRALVDRWGVDDLADVHSVADWIESRPWVDPQRVAVMGAGDGGFLTHWVIGHTGRFRCAVSTGGPSDFLALHGTSDAGARLRAEFHVPPWEAHERYWRTSPLAYVEHMRTPLLILQGERDRRCPPSQADELYTALAHLGRDVEMLQFLGEDHDFPRTGRPRNRRERLRRILDWLERKL